MRTAQGWDKPDPDTKTRLFENAKHRQVFATNQRSSVSCSPNQLRFAGLAAHAGALHPIPSRTRPLNPPAAMILRPKTRESSPSPVLQTANKTQPNHNLSTRQQPFIAGWSSPVARQAHNLKAAGSNPAPATIFWFQTVSHCPISLASQSMACFFVEAAKTPYCIDILNLEY